MPPPASVTRRRQEVKKTGGQAVNGRLEDKRAGRDAGICERSSHKNKFLPLIGKVRMGFKQYPPHPSLIREGENKSQNELFCPNVLASYRLKRSPLTLTLSHRGRGNYINLMKRTYSPKPTSLFTHHSSLRNKAAFTLAEVLITLGIIGVVAAITIPNLITNHKKKVLPVRLQKFYSTFNNALQMSQVDNGDIISWELPNRSEGTDDSRADSYQYFNKYILSYMKGIRKCPPGDTECNYELDPDVNAENGKNYSRFVFTDGSCFGLNAGWTNERNARIHGFFDYNCNGKPNKAGKDEFAFYMNFATNSSSYTPFQYTNFYSNGKKLSTMDREEVKELCKNEPQNCGALIQYDGWRIADDYPGKI